MTLESSVKSESNQRLLTLRGRARFEQVEFRETAALPLPDHV